MASLDPQATPTVTAIPQSEWKWCGYAGHFIGASSCRMHLHTRVGDYRISTVGDYRPPHKAHEPYEIGFGRTYETFVFRVTGDEEHGMGEPGEYIAIDAEGYTEAEAACLGHMAMCAKYAEIAGAEGS